MANYTKHYATKVTPQSQPIPGSKQVANSAGGFSFAVDDWQRLDRFLILGSEGGSYYASEQKLTVENAESVRRCIQMDGLRTVARIVEISEGGRAPKNDPAIFCLAMALKLGDEKTRKAAKFVVSRVCRIGTHIFALAEAIDAFGGWGRNTRSAFELWYVGQDPAALALNLIKYQNRHGWTHRDLLRKCHARGAKAGKVHESLFRWVTREGNLSAHTVERRVTKDAPVIRTDEYPEAKNLPALIPAFEALSKMRQPYDAAKLIAEYSLPRECVPTELLNSPEVWTALLTGGKGMPFTAMIRNLGKMASIGLLAPLSDAERYVVKRLSDHEGLRKARVHPIAVLLAQSVYASGHGVRGGLTWNVSQKVTDALNDSFYGAFKGVVPTGKRHLLAIDVSGSMDGGGVAGTPLTPREAAGALALVTANVEENYHIVGFTAAPGRTFYDPGAVSPIAISAKTRLDDACRIMKKLPMGGTDAALPILYAAANKLSVDAFVVLTDNETWAGQIHPAQALNDYRQKTGIPAKLVAIGMTATEYSIGDPNDAGTLSCVGMDANTPSVVSDFIRN